MRPVALNNKKAPEPGAFLLVSQERFERSASSSAGKRSNPLSYWDICD